MATFVDSLRGVYWFDLLREESQQRLLAGARRLLAGGTIQVQSQVNIIVAQRL